MMKGDKLNQLMHTAGHTLSSFSCTHFSLSNMKSPWKNSLHHAAENVKPTDVIWLKLQNMKISHYIFVFKFILLSIFYSLSLYHSINIIILLDSFSHVAEMLSPLMLRLELQVVKISQSFSIFKITLLSIY